MYVMRPVGAGRLTGFARSKGIVCSDFPVLASRADFISAVRASVIMLDKIGILE